jgi:hypothetical protein
MACGTEMPYDTRRRPCNFARADAAENDPQMNHPAMPMTSAPQPAAAADIDAGADDVADERVTPPRFRPVPWTMLETPQDVELWIAEHNQSLQEHIAPNETGYGVRFDLAVGGTIAMQTSGDAIFLDVDADAEWVAPLLTAATGVAQPVGHYWVLPEDKLVQLVLGLSTLIASTTLIVGHKFGSRHRMMAA